MILPCYFLMLKNKKVAEEIKCCNTKHFSLLLQYIYNLKKKFLGLISTLTIGYHKQSTQFTIKMRSLQSVDMRYSYIVFTILKYL